MGRTNRNNKGRVFTLVILVSLLVSACIVNMLSYNYRLLRIAWDIKNTYFLKHWISNLDELEYNSFKCKMTDFATTTNFCFGYFDVESTGAEITPKANQKIIIHNCMLVNTLYLDSKLFLKPNISFKKSLFIQEHYFKENSLISKEDSLAIKLKLDSIAIAN